MPLYDRTCTTCDWRAIDVWETVASSDPTCPDCGAVTERAWLSKPSNVIGDEIDVWQENGPPTPIHFRSRLERKRWMKERGFQEVAKNAGPDDKHCPRWVVMDAKTLENATILVTRQSTYQGKTPEGPPKMRITYVRGEGIG